MLQVVYGVGTNINDAAKHAIEEYNKIEARKTFRLRDYTQYEILDSPDNSYAFQCEIWFEIPDPTPEEQQAAKFEFVGSTEIDPSDPDWREKWQAQQQQVATMEHIVDH